MAQLLTVRSEIAALLVIENNILAIIMALNKLVISHLSSKSTKSYAINAMAKLTNRVSPAALEKIRTTVHQYGTSMILELQQRSVEFSALFNKVFILYETMNF